MKKLKNRILCMRFPFLYIGIDEYGEPIVRNKKLENRISELMDDAIVYFYEDSTPDSKVVKKVVNYKAYNKAKIIKWYYEHIYKRLHMNLSETWLDEMPYGWKKAFGINLCRELKKALLSKGGKDALKQYKVEQVKEKFGSLRWYDNTSDEDISDIINKYEYISSKTCVSCGRSATVLTCGWICPYCDECAPEGAITVEIKF